MCHTTPRLGKLTSVASHWEFYHRSPELDNLGGGILPLTPKVSMSTPSWPSSCIPLGSSQLTWSKNYNTLQELQAMLQDTRLPDG